MSDVQKALNIAREAHEGQKDKAGIAYIFHPMGVESMLVNYEDEYRVVALLHDVVEDTSMTIEDLRAQGFSETILEAIDAITRREGEVYVNFLERVKKNEIARIVKRMDVIHNLSRLHLLQEKDRKGLEKRYRRALLQLRIQGGQK